MDIISWVVAPLALYALILWRVYNQTPKRLASRYKLLQELGRCALPEPPTEAKQTAQWWKHWPDKFPNEWTELSFYRSAWKMMNENPDRYQKSDPEWRIAVHGSVTIDALHAYVRIRKT